MATIREPNIQPTERDQKQNVIAAMNSFYFQVLCLNVFQFQPNRNVFYSYDDEFFVRNLESCVKKASNGTSHLGTTNVRLFPFSSDRVSYEILSMASSLFSM